MTEKIQRGRPALARIKVTPEFASHVAAFRAKSGITLRALVGLAFDGDDSTANYQAVGIVLRYAAPDSLHTQGVIAALAKATSWPAKKRAVEAL